MKRLESTIIDISKDKNDQILTTKIRGRFLRRVNKQLDRIGIFKANLVSSSPCHKNNGLWYPKLKEEVYLTIVKSQTQSKFFATVSTSKPNCKEVDFEEFIIQTSSLSNFINFIK